MIVLADKQARLDDVLVLLTEAQIKTEERFQQVAEHARQADARMDERMKELEEKLTQEHAKTEEADRRLDERIEQLVSAIGEMLRARNGGQH